MFDTMIASPMFGFVISLIFFEVGVAVQNKTKSTLANPLLICAILVMLCMKLFGISYDEYNNGAQFIGLFLSPCTALLAVNIYKNMDTIKKYLLPILLGTASAAGASMGCVYLLCRVLNLDEEIALSLLPKSVTTAISMPLAEMTGGTASILVAATIITGMLCAMISPLLIRIFRFKNPVAAGIAIGSSGHGVGTAAAIKIGPVQGATAGIAIGMSGLFTVLFYSFIFSV